MCSVHASHRLIPLFLLLPFPRLALGITVLQQRNISFQLGQFERLKLVVSSHEQHFLDADQLATLELFFTNHVCAPPFYRQAASCFMQIMCLPLVVLKNVTGLMQRHLQPK